MIALAAREHVIDVVDVGQLYVFAAQLVATGMLGKLDLSSELKFRYRLLSTNRGHFTEKEN